MKKISLLFVFVWFCISVTQISGQTFALEGYVKSVDNASLTGTTVYDKTSGKGTITNEQGYYRLNLEKGRHEISVSYVGYQGIKRAITLESDSKMNFFLKLASLDEVTIVASKRRIHLNSVQKPMEMDMVSIKAVPSIIGEPDIMKAITIMPGISSTSEISSNLTIRGASHDQNLIILDEAPLYQTGHLFGFISPFNYSAVKDVKVFKNTIPAIYGGKLSSVIELHSNNGNRDSLKWNYYYGMLNGGFSISTPIVKKKLTFFVAARTFYLGLITLPLYVMYQQGRYSSFSTYYLYDINSNIKYTPNEKEEFGLYVYNGTDNLISRLYPDKTDIDKENITSLDWGNLTVSLKYKRKINSKLFFKNHITFSKSFNNTVDKYKDYNNTENDEGKYRVSSLKNISLKSYFEKYYGIHYLRYGFESGYYYITPFDYIKTGLSNSHIFDNYGYSQVDAFFDDLIDKGKWSIYFGLRYSNYFTGSKFDWHIEPRISYNYHIAENRSIGIGYQHLAQYNFLLPITNLGLPNDMWVSIVGDMQPSLVDQVFLEYNHSFLDEKIGLESGIFYRYYSNLYDIKNKTSFLFTAPVDWQKKMSKNGIGAAYGLELQLNIDFKKHKAIISYTYSRSKYRFTDINLAQWYPGYYDFPHQLDINIAGKISRKWSYSLLFKAQSGKPVTLPKEILTHTLTGDILVYGAKNGNRLSPYHRLDLSVSRTWKSKKGKIKTLTFSLYNAYYHKNPFYYELVREKIVVDKETHRPQIKKIPPYIEEITLIPLIPSLSYSVKI